MKKSLFYTAVMALLLTGKAYSQGAFSLINANKMVLNPAFTGLDTTFKHEASLYGKTYFDDLGAINRSTTGTYQMNLDKIHSGAGIMVNYNYVNLSNSETLNQIATRLYYRYSILPGLSIGADAGFVNMNNHYQFQQITGYGFSPAPYNNMTFRNFDFDAGIGFLYQLKFLYAGFSVDHLTKPLESFPGTDPIGNFSDNMLFPMLNYKGIAYHGIIGGTIPLVCCDFDIKAYYYSEQVNFNATFEAPHFFVGTSIAFVNYLDYSIPQLLSINSSYNAVMAGIKVYHSKMKVSFCYNFMPPHNSQYAIFNSAECALSYSF